MTATKMYSLAALPYEYAALAPAISEEQLRLHHSKHHQAYVNGANAVLEKLDKARKESLDLDMKATLKELAFHLGGNRMHTMLWENMAPAGKGGGGAPSGKLGEMIAAEFGSFERFKKEFTQAAVSVEGSGWAVMTYCDGTDRVGIMQVEKHNANFPVGYPLLMALDVWEHAYYLDYKNDRAKFVEAFWNIVNWDIVNKWFQAVVKPQPAMAKAK
jgi:Fe-Mn family superoxide dismutase